MPTLHINGQLVAGITLGGQQVQKIQDGNGNTLYDSTPVQQVVETPAISVEPSTTICESDGLEYRDGNDIVTITCATEGATIYWRYYSQTEVYDVDNDTYTVEWVLGSDWAVLNDSIITIGGYYLDNLMSQGEYKIEAKATKANYSDSEVQTAIYTSSEDVYSSACTGVDIDCTDCSNWVECGYSSYDDCECSVNGNCPITITLSYPSSDNEPFDYSTSDGESGSISTVGDSVDVVISYSETIDFTTAASKEHICINDSDQGNGPSYSYGWSAFSDGDVVTCVHNSEPC